MTSPLQRQLLHHSISAEALAKSGIEKTRAEALIAGADPTITEVRAIATNFKISVRSIIAGYSESATSQYKLRENFRTEGSADIEIFDLITRAETLAQFLPENTSRRTAIKLPFESKTFDAAEELAAFCRDRVLHVDYRIPLIDLDERLVTETDIRTLIIDQPHLEGSIVAHHDHLFIFLSTRPDPRMRFTLAHELCHYLCDLSSSGNSAWFDEDILHPTGSNRRDEVFANSFASALLLPPTAVGEALAAFRDRYKLSGDTVSDVEVLLLARFFGVSFQVAARRLEDLKVMPEGGGQSLYEAVRKRFGSPEKLAAELQLPARPEYDWSTTNSRVAKEARESVSKGTLSIGRLAELVNIPVAQLMQMVGQ